MVKYPKVKVKLGNLGGPDGDALGVMGRVTAALKNAGVAKDQTDAFIKDATSGNYEHLLATAFEWVNIKFG